MSHDKWIRSAAFAAAERFAVNAGAQVAVTWLSRILADQPPTTCPTLLASQPCAIATSIDLQDRHLLVQAHFALRNSGYRPLSLIECESIDGVIVLSGVVGSFYFKQVAQEAVLRVFRNLELVGRVENRINVHAR